MFVSIIHVIRPRLTDVGSKVQINSAVIKSYSGYGARARGKFVSDAKYLAAKKFYFKFLVLSDCVE